MGIKSDETVFLVDSFVSKRDYIFRLADFISIPESTLPPISTRLYGIPWWRKLEATNGADEYVVKTQLQSYNSESSKTYANGNLKNNRLLHTFSKAVLDWKYFEATKREHDASKNQKTWIYAQRELETNNLLFTKALTIGNPGPEGNDLLYKALFSVYEKHQQENVNFDPSETCAPAAFHESICIPFVHGIFQVNVVDGEDISNAVCTYLLWRVYQNVSGLLSKRGQTRTYLQSC